MGTELKGGKGGQSLRVLGKGAEPKGGGWGQSLRGGKGDRA